MLLISLYLRYFALLMFVVLWPFFQGGTWCLIRPSSLGVSPDACGEDMSLLVHGLLANFSLMPDRDGSLSRFQAIFSCGGCSAPCSLRLEVAEGPRCRDCVVECRGFVASPFDLHFFCTFSGGIPLYILEGLHRSCLIKNLTTIRSPLCEE